MSTGNMMWSAWWQHADWVVRAVFAVLIGLSLMSWTVIIHKAVQLRRAARLERRWSRRLSAADALHQIAADLPPATPSAPLVAEALRVAGRERNRQILDERLGHLGRLQRTELENGLTLLATTGSAAPFIGLLGTVWGIMHALQVLGGVAALSMDAVAGPVSEALVATAVGLFAAIPAVVAYNLLLRRLRRISALMEGSRLALLDLALLDPARAAEQPPRPQVVMGGRV